MASDKQELFSGMFWTAVARYSPLLVSTVVSMVLARLLVPEQFGIVALSTVLIAFLTMLSTMGIAPAIIQRQDLTKSDLNNIFSFSCYVGLLLAVVLFILSWPMAVFYGTPDLVIVCQLLSISLFFNTINMVPNALMTKNLRFKENAKRTFLLQIMTGPLSVLIAYLGGGIYALLISPIISAIGIFMYNHHFYPVRFILLFDFTSIKKILSYSMYQFMFQFVNFFTGNIDKIVIGKALGTSDLGYYQKGYQLVQQPAGMITGVVYPVLHPIFTKYQDNLQLLYHKYSAMIRLLVSVTLPLSCLLYFCGPEIIRIFYGDNWDSAIPAFKIMALAVPINVILPVTGTFFQSSGQIKYLFYTGITNAICAIGYVLIASFAFGNIESIAWAILFSQLTNFVVTYFFVYNKILNCHLYKSLDIFGRPFIFVIVLAAILYFENRFLGDIVIANLLLKCLTTLIFTSVYIHISGQYDIRALSNKLFSKFKN